MTHTVKMHHHTNIAEEEVQRRLAACYDLLLKLADSRDARPSGNDGPGLTPQPAAIQDGCKATADSSLGAKKTG